MRALTSPTATQQYTIEFKNSLAQRVVEMGAMTATNVGTTAGMEYTISPKAGSVAPATGAVHVLEGYAADVQGSFTLSFAYGGSTYTTGAIDAQASASVMAAAVAAASNGSGAFSATGATVEVSVTAQDQWKLTFGGAALGAEIPAINRAFTPAALPQATLTSQSSGIGAFAGTYFTNDIDLAVFAGTDAAAVKDAILGATRLDGTSLEDVDVDVTVALDAATGTWSVRFGGSAVNQSMDVLRVMASAETAVDADLTQTQTGATSSEVQTLALGATGAVQLGYRGQYTDIVLAENLDAAALQSGLEGLSTIGAGNVSVALNDDGSFAVSFIGDLAGVNASGLAIAPVASVDLAVSDGAIADLIKVKVAGATDWQRTAEADQTLEGDAKTTDLLASLTRAIGLLPDVGLG
ncbi:MAG: hypothetical protein VX878_06325, partial [Pseudomonadota bacterium]|nr:hypothetical protein [Pseudomonadota bacterium]